MEAMSRELQQQIAAQPTFDEDHAKAARAELLNLARDHTLLNDDPEDRHEIAWSEIIDLTDEVERR